MTPTATTTRSAFDELADLEQKVRDAEAGVRDAEIAKRRAQRERDTAAAELQTYYAGIGQGEAPDAKREAELRARADEMQSGLVPRTVADERGTRVEMVDPAAEGRIAGALARVDDAKDAVQAFIVAERERLQAELVEKSTAAHAALVAGIEALFEGMAAWRGARGQWLELGQRWGIAPAEVPLTPLDGIALDDIQRTFEQTRGGARDPRGLYPMPVRLAPGSDPDVVEYAASLAGWSHVPRVISSEGGILGA